MYMYQLFIFLLYIIIIIIVIIVIIIIIIIIIIFKTVQLLTHVIIFREQITCKLHVSSKKPSISAEFRQHYCCFDHLNKGDWEATWIHEVAISGFNLKNWLTLFIR